MVKKLSLGVIPGDGIGGEVVAEALKTLAVAVSGALDLSVTNYQLGADHFLATGEILSDETLEDLAGHDALLMGAVGGDPSDTRLSGGIIERGLLLKLRFSFDHFVNLRPTKSYQGIDSPVTNSAPIDFVVVREGTEGPYAGNGGTLRAGTAREIATEVSVNTAHGVERVLRFAFEKAVSRRKKLTLVHKTNVLVHAGGLWARLFREIQEEFPSVETDYLHIDAATIFMVTDPARFDVIVTDNLFGDIITDLAGAVGGGIGLAASANLNLEGTFPSLFEPVHGSAPDIAGSGMADPSAAILSASLMLEHQGELKIANALSAAVSRDIESRNKIKASRSTSEIGDAIRELLA